MSERYREVVIFLVGLMKDPRPLVQHVYEMSVEYFLYWMRAGYNHPEIDTDLFWSLHAESTVQLPHPLHNKYINYYDHDADDYVKRPLDTTPVYWPSRLYNVRFMKRKVTLGKYKKQGTEIPECAMHILRPDQMVEKHLFSMCQEISKHQAVTDLRMARVDYNDITETEAPIFSRNIRSLDIFNSWLSLCFIRKVLQQLHDCVTLTLLKLEGLDLQEVEEDLDELLENLVSNHEKGLFQNKLTIEMEKSGLSEGFASKWNERCEGITRINCDIRSGNVDRFLVRH